MITDTIANAIAQTQTSLQAAQATVTQLTAALTALQAAQQSATGTTPPAATQGQAT